ncbi:MAG: Lon protease family protein [Myxococcota bacterium]
MRANELAPAALLQSCRPADVPFESTDQAPELTAPVGQERALEALRFGIGIPRDGFNLFAIGPSGVGKSTLLKEALTRQAASGAAPSDWCYVHDFDNPERPRALELPPGVGGRLQREMSQAVAELRTSMNAAFESEEYRTRKQRLHTRFKEQQEAALGEVQERARGRDIAVVQTESGLVLGPLRDGEPLDPEKFGELPKAQQLRLQEAMEAVGAELQELLKKFREWGRAHMEDLKALDAEIAATVAHRSLEAVQKEFASFPAVADWLKALERDVIASADEFLQASPEDVEAAVRRAFKPNGHGPSFRRYVVNLLVDQSGVKGAPVVHEDNPTWANLIGRIEHESQFGALVANFTLIRAGAFHRANGGYLVLDALKVLQRPWAWEAIKRTLRARQIRIESLGQSAGLVSTVTLEPEPIPLRETKVVLTGERTLFYLMSALDPDVPELFKVLVDFEDRMDRSAESQATYCQLVASLVKKEGARPFDRGAVARTIDFAARKAGDGEKLSLHLRGVVDLIREADYCARERKHDRVGADDVQAAIDAQERRGNRVKERLLEGVRRGEILISTAGERVGQVNGLAVFQLGEQSFGTPTRITARVRLGKGEVVDIEREVELGGPIHSKGVLILSGFLGGRFARDFPLAFGASLVFEQSYGQMEGDSASMAELCALLSALSEVPIRQALAITGSVNQHGDYQVIGGVNEKIEGFFDVCAQAGLTGQQGVVIPQSNVKNLMLRRDVVRAVEEGKFHLYAAKNVDEVLELLTGQEAGERDASGKFPAGTVNARVEARLAAFAEAAKSFGAGKEAPKG